MGQAFLHGSGGGGCGGTLAVTAPVGSTVTVSLDVSALTGNYYICAGQDTNGSAWDNARKQTITEVKGIQ